MSRKNFILVLPGILLLVIAGWFVYYKFSSKDLKIDYSQRPSKEVYVYDYARILEEVSEYAHNYLKRIRENFGIEAVIVTLPSLDRGETIEEAAVKLFNNWKIGQKYAGRGIMLLLADREKQVKLEVSYELEDVFTDAFCGYIEDLQLRPYFLGGQLGIGMLAVMEELENRAQIKSKGDYTIDYISQLDRELLSGGAGAKRDLSKFKKEKIKDVGTKYPAGRTPREAWQIRIQSWRDKVRTPYLGVYTELTKLIYRDYQNLPDSRFEKSIRKYANKPYEVIQNENYAVIFFGNKKGWDNAPFLFCKTNGGWKYDIVHQRKYIRFGPSPYWGIERANYPYIDLLSDCPYYTGQDIPLEGEDIYKIEDDQRLAEEILRLEEAYKRSPNDFNIVMELGRLYTITSMGPRTMPILKKAKRLNPQSPLPYKYLAIEYVDSAYQYKSAIKEMKEYVKREPQDVFGHNFLGYLYFQVGDYEKAIKEFNEAVKLRPDNCYAYCKLSRSYTQLYLQMSQLNPRRILYKNLAIEMLNKAKNTATPDHRRIGWLEDWLKKKGVLD